MQRGVRGTGERIGGKGKGGTKSENNTSARLLEEDHSWMFIDFLWLQNRIGVYIPFWHLPPNYPSNWIHDISLLLHETASRPRDSGYMSCICLKHCKCNIKANG